MQKKPRCAAYIRVSRDTSDYERQITDLKRIAEREGYLLEEDDIYAEKITGFSKGSDRAALTRMLTAMRSGAKKYQIVFSTEVSRIARKPKFGREIVEELTELGCPIKFTNVGMPSLDSNGKPDRMFNIIFNLLLEMAEEEVMLTQTRSKSGRAERARKGAGFAGPFLPYGYTKDEDKRLVECSEEAPIVREIFNMAEQDLGGQAIARILNTRGIPTKKRKAALRSSKVTFKDGRPEKDVESIEWTNVTVYGILTNTIYIGQRVHAGEVVKAPELITEEQFYRVQNLMKARNNNQTGRNVRYPYILSTGKLVCGCCGKNYHPKYRPGKEAYYQCSVNRTYKQCENMGVGIVPVDSSIWWLFKDNPTLLEKVKDTKDFKKAKEEVDTLKHLLDVELKEKVKKETAIDRLLKAYLMGVKGMTDDRLKMENQKLEKQIKQHEKRVHQLKMQISAKTDQSKFLDSIANRWEALQSMAKTRQGKREVLDMLVDKVVVTAVEKHRNNNRYILSVFLRDVLPPITILLYVKPKNVTSEQFQPGFSSFNGMFHFATCEQPELVEYDEQNRLVTPVEQVVELIEDFNPEHYHEKDLTPEELDGEWQLYYSIPKPIPMEEAVEQQEAV